MAKTKSINEVLEEYLPLIEVVKGNIDKINEKKHEILPEYTNLYNFLFSSILLMNYPCEEKENEIVIQYKSREFTCETDIIKGILQDSYGNINFSYKKEKEECQISQNESISEIKNTETTDNDTIDELKEVSSNSEIIQDKKQEEEIEDNDAQEYEKNEDEGNNIEKEVMEEYFDEDDNFEFEDEKIKNSNEGKTITAEQEIDPLLNTNESTIEVQPQINFVEDENENTKDKENFILNKHHIKIEDSSGFQFEFEVIVYPMEYSSHELAPVRILTSISKNGKFRVHFSSKAAKSKSIIVNFDDYNFYVKGCWKNGIFESDIFPQDTNFKILESDIEHISSGKIPKYFGKHFDTGNGYIEFFPISLTNDEETGCVTSVAICDTGEEEETLVFPDNENMINIPTDGKYLQFETFWTGKDYRVYDS